MLWQQPVEDALHRLHADIFWLIISHLMLWLQQVEMTTICRYFLVDSEPFDAVVQPVGNLMLCCNKLKCPLLAACRYFLVGPTAQQTRSFDWLRDHLPTDGSVQLSDVTSMYTALDVIGPKAKELLSELTDTPLSKQDFPHMTCKVRVSSKGQ